MKLTLREAAVVMGCSQRTLRARLARGTITGTKIGGHWQLEHSSLPLTEAQRLALQARSDEVRAVLEEALPSRAAVTRDRKARSILDFDGFRTGQVLLREMRAANEESAAGAVTEDVPGARGPLGGAIRSLERGLLLVAEGSHAFEPAAKLTCFRGARRWFSRSVARLLLLDAPAAEAAAPPSPAALLRWVATLEQEILPSLIGVLRWSERKSRGQR